MQKGGEQVPAIVIDGKRAQLRQRRRRRATTAQTRAKVAEPEQVRKVGRELWLWLGWYDPEAVGAGRWERLPRSHA
jgi:hypothetical protein